MIEVVYYYVSKLTGHWMKATKTFYDVKKAVRFIYKVNRTMNMSYDGEFTCDDPEDTEYINSHVK